MNFATLSYAAFLLVIVVGYWAMPRRAGRWWLIGASIVFYASWNPLYVPGFLGLLIANWLLGLVAAGGRARLAITLAVLLDVGVLAIFKYLDWVVGSSMNLLAWLVGRPVDLGTLGLILPLAISFVTFTMLAYVIDIGRGARPERELGRFSLFVLFFPHLIAGPIMRGHEFLPQVRHPRPFAIEHLRIALPLIVGGLLKKVLGDNLAPRAELVFADPAAWSSIALWIGLVAFAFQILLDFSGYTDMALGSAALLGFRLPPNFNWPYRALSVQDFWRRWHMTLSRWLRDYLYIPLGGSRHGPARTYLALMLTMVLGGLWHGAGLTFIVWGAWHGIGLCAHRWYRTNLADRLRVPTIVAWALTFGFVLIGWVFFRSASIEVAAVYLRGLFIPQGGSVTVALGATGLVLLAFIIGQWPGVTTWASGRLPAGSRRRYLAYGLALAGAIALVPVQTTAFIYFQF